LPLSLWSVSGILFIAAAWQLVRTRRAAFGLFALAYLLSLIGSGVDTLIPDYSDASRRAFTFTQPNFRRDVLIPVASALLPVVMGAVLWWSSRPPLHQGNSDEAG
jgi:glucose dehydrogenase